MRFALTYFLICFFNTLLSAQSSTNEFFSGTWQMCDNEGYLELFFIKDEVYFNTSYSAFGLSFKIEYEDSLYYYQPVSDGFQKIPIPYQILSKDTVIFYHHKYNYFDNTVAVRMESNVQRPIIQNKEQLKTLKSELEDYEDEFNNRQSLFNCIDYSEYVYEDLFERLLRGHWYIKNRDSYEEMIFKKKMIIVMNQELGVKEYSLEKDTDKEMLFFINSNDTVKFRNVIFTKKDELIMRRLDGFRLKMMRLDSQSSLDTSFKGYMDRRSVYMKGIK
ncbi:MAG: hypothetical protein AAF149_22260 [Bacteroidota bacterium]